MMLVYEAGTVALLNNLNSVDTDLQYYDGDVGVSATAAGDADVEHLEYVQEEVRKYYVVDIEVAYGLLAGDVIG